MLLVIRGRGREGYLTGDISKPSFDAANSGVWGAENAIIMAWLINSMEPSIKRTYLFYKSASEIWQAVQETYSDLENTAQSFQIRSNIRTTRQGSNSVTTYFNILTTFMAGDGSLL